MMMQVLLASMESSADRSTDSDSGKFIIFHVYV